MDKKKLEQEYKALNEKRKQRNKYNNELIKEKYDRISVTLPKGSKEKIIAAGESVNGLVNRLVLEFLEGMEGGKE